MGSVWDGRAVAVRLEKAGRRRKEIKRRKRKKKKKRNWFLARVGFGRLPHHTEEA